MRLWLSYQRYGLLLVLGAALLVGLGLAVEFAWWGWGLVALVIATSLPLSVHVFTGYRRKWWATQLATRRIARGSFHPHGVRAWCEDPCWRVVAAEVLRRAGLPRSERNRLIRRLSSEAKAQAHALLIIDHEKGTLLEIEGDAVTRLSFPPRTV